MINGMIKLFYSEVVKTKMNGMNSGEYELRDDCKEIRNITLKIDSVLSKVLKIIAGIIMLILAFNINIMLGMGTLLISIAYGIYKIKLEQQILENLDNIKETMENSKINELTDKAKMGISDFTEKTKSEKAKSGINGMVILLIIGVITNFNVVIIASFITVFVCTIKEICSQSKG